MSLNANPYINQFFLFESNKLLKSRGRLKINNVVNKLNNTKYSNMSWTDEKVAKLKSLWGKGNTASEIADILGIEGSSSYVRVSQLKKQAVDKLIENVDHSQVIDFL